MTEQAGRVPVVLVVDVEPDEHVYPVDAPSSWDAFALLVARLTALRTQLEDRTGNPVAFSWALRMDPQVERCYGSATYVVDQYADLVGKLLDAGDELGIHPHAWRWNDGDDEWVSDHTDQSWLDECLDLNVESYRSSFGRPPSHHRFGAAFMNSAVMQRLGHHGVPVDLTLEPGAASAPDGRRLGGRFVGGTGDFREVPRGVYRPDAHDFRVPACDDTAGPVAIPLTSGVFNGRRNTLRNQLRHPVATSRYALRALGDPAAYVRRRSGSATGGHEPLAMWLDWHSPAAFWDAAFAAADEVAPRCLSFAIRSSTGYAEGGGQRFDAIMAQLLADPRARDLHFTTPTGALRELGQSISG